MKILFRIAFSAALLVFGIIFLGRSHANAAPTSLDIEPVAVVEILKAAPDQPTS